jgi:hypothetical protein
MHGFTSANPSTFNGLVYFYHAHRHYHFREHYWCWYHICGGSSDERPLVVASMNQVRKLQCMFVVNLKYM